MELIDISTQISIDGQIPNRAFTRSKIAFDPRPDQWHWKDGAHEVQIDFTSLPSRFQHFSPQLKQCLMVFAKGYSASYVINLFNGFLHFCRAISGSDEPCERISKEEVSKYRQSLDAHEAWRLGGLNPLVQKWFDLSLPGVTEDCVSHLKGQRKPGNDKGAAVRQRDPEKGPFSEEEFRSLFRAVDAAYGSDVIPVWLVAMFRLLSACGGRTSQYASLKIKDFQRASSNGATLQLPQVKTGSSSARDHFLTFDISLQTAHIVDEHISILTSKGYGPSSAMFPLALLLEHAKVDSRSEHDLFHGHLTTSQLRDAFCRLMKPIAPFTDRLGFTQIPVSPRRFRYTFGTRMAEEGCSRAVIANRLGHTDLQNVEVYFEASPAIIENIDRAMNAGLAPIAEAFCGRLIEDESQATLGGATGSRIIDFRTSTSAVGSCGQNKGCSFNKPVACYTCFKFEPWLDAPHEQLLERLQSEREKSADSRMASINDGAIKAIKEVIAECRVVREQRAAKDAA